MNNIYFFNHFNNLINTYKKTHENIDDLIKYNFKYNKDIGENEKNIISKYNELNIFLNRLFDNINIISHDVNKYINDNCLHDWTMDIIDIDPEQTMQIKYCIHCGKT
jgi:flagellar biosynthesis chaperone FliJ